jgi:RNA-directed DNA polymerase
MERVLERGNMLDALKRVRRNKGAAGVDRMSVEALPEYLKTHWPKIRQQLLDGSYEPKPVRHVDIPKPDGSKRGLGIPTVLDRLIQQAVLQVLQPQFDKTFSERSFGFRPGKSAHQAVRQARQFVQAGLGTVVDIDLAKFFDHVDHDILMGKLAKRIDDKRLLVLIRRYLRAGAFSDGTLVERREGTPQGGPLSPLLANVMLDEVDRFLHAHGRQFVRYADDCNVYVANERVGQRVLRQLRKVYARLKLPINEAKTAVASVNQRKLLGYTVFMMKAKKKAAVRISTTAEKKFKAAIRMMTKSSHSRSIEQFIAGIAPLIRGWGNYFSLAPKARMAQLDAWIRRRLRMIQIKQWGGGTKARKMLRALGAPSRKVHFEFGKQWDRHWHVSGLAVVEMAMPARYFTEKGLPSLEG